jgi:hypothetical protein
MTLLDRQTILDTAHELYIVSVGSRMSELGMRIPREWADQLEMVPRLDDADQLAKMWRIIGRVEQAWGFDVGLVFHHGAIDQNRGLFYLVMGCMGHGVSLADDFGDNLDKAGEILACGLGAPKVFDPSPIYIDDPWMDAAETAFPDQEEVISDAS